MTVICIGPCCIPLYSIIPIIILCCKRIYDWFMARLGLQRKEQENQEGILKAIEKERAEKNECCNKNPSLRKRGKRDKMASVVVIQNEKEFQNMKEKSESHMVVIDFTATWCKPCQKIAPFYADLAKQHLEGQCFFLKVDVDALDEVAAECQVSAMPTFQIYRKGTKIDQLQGADEEALEKLVQKYCTCR